MNQEEQTKLVEAMQKQIAFLLADLEKRTGSYVEGIEVRNVEVTGILSASPEYSRRVVIDLRRQPGSLWDV